MKTVLMVAEKPSLAQSLAEILSGKHCSSRKGFNNTCSIHEWKGIFQNQNVLYKMTSVCGHVMSLDFPGKYNNWDKVDPAELFKCSTEKKEAVPKLRMVDFLGKEAKGVDYLVLWLDCDKEGENICFEVIDAVKYSMNNSNRSYEETIFRAKFSAITERDIKAAMQNLAYPNENEARSVDARQELDLRIGCAFTRFQTKFFQGKYGNLDSNLISFGPCQTPTLGFCVERHDFIQSFKPETYWTLHVKAVDESGKDLILSWDRCRCFEKEIANIFLNNVSEHKKAKVMSVTTKEKAKGRPAALNTVELMRIASSGLGMGPQHAMTIAERLYIQGYISYPRTETTHYSENFDLKGALRVQSNHSDWGSTVRDILKEGVSKPKKGHDAGDHPPITPMKAAEMSQLDHDSWRLYEYIVKHFIGTLMPDCTYLSTSVDIVIGGENFNITGKTLIDPGFTKVMTWLSFEDEIIPKIKKGDELTVVEVKLIEKQTSPPDYLTESELITLMEKHGIGTDASIPVHINNIGQRNYVTVTQGRKLMPTNLGIVLVHGYQKIDPDLVLPTMRSAVEEQLNLIALGKAEFESVLSHTLEIFLLKFQYFVKNICRMDELFEVSFSPLSAAGRPLSRCGKCRRYLKLVETKPIRLHCVNCDDTYSVPPNGMIREFMENKCPLDDFQLLTWSGGSKGKSYIFCPYCYNNSPFSSMPKASGCNSCLHPSCSFSRDNTGVSVCMECPSGLLVLDPSSGPKWRIGCNRCDVIIYLFDKASKVQVLPEVCEECGSQFLSVEYKEGKSKLRDDNLSASGCIFCSPVLIPLVEKHRASTMSANKFRGRGRGGRSSRGGRGRTRGRGRR